MKNLKFLKSNTITMESIMVEEEDQIQRMKKTCSSQKHWVKWNQNLEVKFHFKRSMKVALMKCKNDM